MTSIARMCISESSPVILRGRSWPLLLCRVIVLPIVVMLRRIASGGSGCCGNARLSVILITLSTTAVVLVLKGLQTHAVEGMHLLAVQLFAEPGTSVAEPDLYSCFRQFCSTTKKKREHSQLQLYVITYKIFLNDLAFHD